MPSLVQTQCFGKNRLNSCSNHVDGCAGQRREGESRWSGRDAWGVETAAKLDGFATVMRDLLTYRVSDCKNFDGKYLRTRQKEVMKRCQFGVATAAMTDKKALVVAGASVFRRWHGLTPVDGN